MRIANPIYDTIIKFLLEDEDIARGFIAVLLDVPVVALEISPQENTIKSDDKIRLLRIDFKAIIKTANQKDKKVLIEIQKSKSGFKISRFRRYLGMNYFGQDALFQKQGNRKKVDLPITAVYLLGHQIAGLKQPIIRVNKQIFDVIQGVVIEKTHKYIELLTHDCLIIQLPKLKDMMPQTELLQVLDVFNEDKYKTDDKNILDYTGDMNDPLVKKMVNRLKIAMSDPDLMYAALMEMDLEESIAEADERAKKAKMAKKKALKKVEEAELKLTEAELKADAAELKLTEAELKADVAELKLTEAEQKITEAKLKADAAEQKITEAKLKADAAELKITEAKLKADAALLIADAERKKAEDALLEIEQLKKLLAEEKAKK